MVDFTQPFEKALMVVVESVFKLPYQYVVGYLKFTYKCVALGRENAAWSSGNLCPTQAGNASA